MIPTLIQTLSVTDWKDCESVFQLVRACIHDKK